ALRPGQRALDQSSNFLTERLLQHPVHDFLNGFRFLAKIAMSAERITRPRLRRAAARNRNERVLIRKPYRITVGSYRALIADMMHEQNRTLDSCEVEAA